MKNTAYNQSVSITSYTLDKDGFFIDFDKNWNQSLITSSPTLQSEQLIGTNLFNYVSGDSTQIWLGTMLQKAQVMGHAEKEYRCDSPNEKRWCRMFITHNNNGKIFVEHHIYQRNKITIDFPNNNDPILRKTSNPNKSTTHHTICSNCCKILFNQSFLELTDFYVITRQLPEDVFRSNNHYVICPECQEG